VAAYFFFSSRRRHTRFSRDWSSDVCFPILEDAIRHSQSRELKGFKSLASALYNDQPRPSGVGLLRLNSIGVAKFVEGISNGKARSEERRVGKESSEGL